ncbi:hypothetical protein B0A61_09635 [Flavobacterium aquatile LMG 4008 = ATCC 11947]|uniref:Ig-like domain-containing protein n=3 Tax=Flavobacterium aquatile TaxID=245 RepID=UPI000B65006E|nr:gliding motility-associated C-terminal domain-containing protein [Flavobacterium aquatile]OXA66995.1 hypothetical protein B0A61_09635 [Flavobacterium aquatile LMG 4008 = ATCC 11947]
MKLIITKIRKVDLNCFVLLLFFLFQSQPIIAQSIPINASIISNQNEVDVATNAIDNDLTTKADVRASTGVLLGIGAYSGFLELEFPSTLPANTTSYVKIDTDDNILPALLGGSLGGLLSDVLGSVLIGNQEFTVQAKNVNTVVLEGNSQIANSFANNNLRIVINSQNEYFIALTPSLPYNRIRLTNRVGSLLGLGNVKRLGVYGAFYVENPDVCGSASYTSFDGAGLNLDLLGLGGAGVTNPHHVIDSDVNNFSHLSLGVIAIAGSINQTVYFDGLSQSSDQFLIRLKVDPSLLALGVANNIQIIGYNNLTVVQSANLNSLLNLDLLTLLQGNQIATIPFAPNAPVNRIMVQYNSLLNVQLTQSLDLYDIKRVPPPPTISDAFTLNPVICSGAAASLVAETITDTVINWYSQPVGGVLLATTNSGQPFVTGILTENTTFYAAAKRATCPEESLRIKIDVEVTDIPIASDIIINSNIDACNGFAVLSPSSTIGGAIFRYYKDQLKTQEITSGYAGDLGVTYVVNSTTGQLTISGLTAVGSPYNYYISLSVNGCENAINTLKEVIVTYSSGLTLNVSSTIEGCGSVNLADAILNFDTSSNIQYQFFDSSNNPISLDAATNITTSGIYSIQSLSLLGGCSSLVVQVNAVVNPIPTLTIPNSNLVVDLGNSATLIATSNSPITWYDSNGNALPSNIAGPFSATGTYAFTAVANNGFCTAIGTIFVTIVDTANCPTITQRVYADTQSWSSILTGGVFDQNNAIDDNPQTFSTIVTGLGLLGIGTTWQTLQWNTTVAAGTPLNVKLGSQYSGLIVAGAYSIVGTKRNSSGVPIDIGAIQPVSGTLLNLLPGENSFEFTFVPSDNTGPKDYDGVRIIVGSIASVAQNIKVYEVYYDTTITQANCALGDVEDVFSGAVDLGIGVATVTVGVDNPYDAVDASLTSYATMYSGAGILAAADLTVSFTTPTLIGESIQIIMSRPSTILDLNLLTGFSIQMYLGNTPVGSILNNSSSLLSLTLLNGGSEALVTIAPQTMVYDRIKIRFGGVAGVLDFLRVHDINRIANTDVIDADATNTIEVCAGETIQLEVVPQDCVNFIWYDAEVGGNIVSTGTSFTIPSTLAPGTYNFYIQPVRYGCETFTRGKVTVIVGQTTPINGITQVQINGNSVTNICSSTGNVTLLAQLNSTLTLTNPIFYWYSLNGTTQQLIAGESTSSLVLTGLAPGTYTYFVGVSSDEFCQTAQGDRTQVTFTILPFSQPSDIVADDVLICSAVDAVVIPTSSLTNPQFFWFFANDATQPIVSGSTVGGITYTIASNGTLTVSGLTISGGPYTYYVGLTSDVSCLNLAGNFKPVVISVGSGTTPTTTDSTQTFCQSTNPTIADIQVNEPNVTWYNSQTSTTALASTDALVNGTIYYGSITDAFGCVSSVRLEVTISISNGTTPTTTATTQTFCQSTNPTIADIQVNEPNVTWYNSQTSTTSLASTDALVNGAIYYGSITDAFGCVSSVRLEVTISISNGTTPTTTASTQTFCQSASPTIADIQVNEPNVTWYNSQTSTTALASTDALVNGTIYYGSITDAFGCVSSIRLEVTISISNGTTPTTTATTQTFCQSANPTIADIQVNEPNVTWYNSQTSTTALASTDALVNGTIYYGSITDAFGCVSSIRLEVTISISNGTTPTTTATTQTFCQSANPTIADIQVNEPSVTWYNSQTSTTALASTDALVNGSIYYGSITDAFGCVSSIRLEVTISISNGTTPTTNSATQTFCQSTNPTIADIQVNEPNVTWYNSQTSTTALASTDALVEGVIYYASIIDGFGCASSIRLEVTIDFTDEAAATITGGSTEECSLNEITYTATTGMTNYIWTVSNGTITSGGLTTDDFVTVSWPTVGAASISVTFDNNCGLPSSATLNLDVVVCSDLTITKTVDNATPSIDDNVTFTITVNNVGSSQLSDIVVNDLLQSGYQFVSATPSVGTYNNLNGVWTIPVINANESATLIVVAKVLPTGDYSNTATIISSTPIDSDVTNNVAGISTEPICLLVYNEFSPNNDGANEFFIIDCIENYPNSKLEVFNRYGVLVYTKNKYINDWDGTANVSGTVNKDDKLPTGTYYYILDLGENDVKKNGWLSIVR